jgi:hypothetical protein
VSIIIGPSKNHLTNGNRFDFKYIIDGKMSQSFRKITFS